MILGMNLRLFTQIHVAISFIAIASGLVVGVCMLTGKLLRRVTTLFLATTVLTSVTGFFFAFKGITPAVILGILSLIVLLIAFIAYYGKHLAAGWPRTYVITAMLALYLNCFVLIAQSFQKIPALHVLAPTGTEAAFKISQAVLLIVFVVWTIAAVRKFRFPLPA